MGKNEAGDYIYNKENNSFLTDADFSQAQEYLRDVVQAITEGKKQGQDQEFGIRKREEFWKVMFIFCVKQVILMLLTYQQLIN